MHSPRKNPRTILCLACGVLCALAQPIVSAFAQEVASAAAAVAPDPAVEQARLVAASVQSFYDQTTDLTASFHQTYVNKLYKRTDRSKGRVVFKKPGKMRWDYEKPEARMFLSNRQVLWLYEPEEKQAFKQDLKSSQLPAALAFLMGKGKITDEFEVEFAKPPKDGRSKTPGRPGDIRLSLSPKQPQSAYKSIIFVVDPKEYLVRESVLVDAQGNTNHFVFDDLQVNVKMADSLFRWSPPSGVRVVDTDRIGR